LLRTYVSLLYYTYFSLILTLFNPNNIPNHFVWETAFGEIPTQYNLKLKTKIFQ